MTYKSILEYRAESGMLRQTGHNNYAAAFRDKATGKIYITGLFHDFDIIDEFYPDVNPGDILRVVDVGFYDKITKRFITSDQLGRELDLPSSALWNDTTEKDYDKFTGTNIAVRRKKFKIIDELYDLSFDIVFDRQLNERYSPYGQDLAYTIRFEFPKMPNDEEMKIVRQALKPGAVGNNHDLDNFKKAYAAVIAWIRHNYTNYDDLLKHGVPRDQARQMISQKIKMKAYQWGYTPN
jgi:hypothetical protein